MSDKDYSLLRPFDLESAKTCGSLIDLDDDECKFIAGPHPVTGEVVVEFAGACGFKTCRAHEIRMAPLAWVEGKPVYKGDVLYSSFFARHPSDKDNITGKFIVGGFGDDGQFFRAEDKHFRTKLESCTWTQPKVKREGWLNLYHGWEVGTRVRPTREMADAVATANRIACIHIEWEEPASQEGE